MEARIHIEDPSPPNCAACYQAKPEEEHVDFGASTDGPMLPAIEGVVGLVGHSVDEIVICRTCISEAGKLLGLEDAEDLRRQLDEANQANDVLHEQLAGQRASVSEALDSLKQHVTGGTPPTLPNSLLPIAPVPARKRKPKTRAR